MALVTKYWNDPDGLTRIYGADKAIPTTTGGFDGMAGPQKVVEINFDYTNLPAVAFNSVLVDTGQRFSLPIGAKVEKVEIRSSVDFDSTSDDMTLNVGTIDLDNSSNGVVDSLVVAATQTELNAGGENVAGWVGALVGGAALTTAKLLTWEVDAHAASAGQGVIRIYYSMVG